MSFRITISPSRRAATRFIMAVRRSILKAYVEEQNGSGLNQSEIARKLNVHRSVINRELRGKKDISLGRVGEYAWAMGRYPCFELVQISYAVGFAMFSFGLQNNPVVNQGGTISVGGIAGGGFTVSNTTGTSIANVTVGPSLASLPWMPMVSPNLPMQTAQSLAA